MEIRYVKADPTGNLTALVESHSSALSRAAVAEAVFASDPGIEQLGFLGESADADVALEMAGGEFCGNACLSAAAWHLRRAGLDSATVCVAISGAEKNIEVEIEKSGSGYSGRVDMPLPLAVEHIGTDFGPAELVRFPGICHIISPASLGREAAEKQIAALCSRLGAEALGLMLYDEAAGSLLPLVYVPGADTLFWEHSCASGTSALGAWLAESRQSSCRLELSQPGGTLSISAEYANGAVSRLQLCGNVELGTAEIIEI